MVQAASSFILAYLLEPIYSGLTIGEIMHAKRLVFQTLWVPVAIAATAAPAAPAKAQPISAIVEEISGTTRNLAAMDLLVQGDTVSLGKVGRLVLGYLRSCLRETIVGGTVTVGAHKSKVVKGKRTAEQVTCDGGTIDNGAKKTSTALGAVFREQGKRRKLPKPDRTLFGISPIVRVSNSAKQLKIVRLDSQDQQPIELAAKLTTIDLAERDIKLEPGGLYHFSDGVVGQVVKISLLARDDVSVLSKFLPM